LRKVEEYRRHADECRQLANLAFTDEQRHQLLHMADRWEGLAHDREQLLARLRRIEKLESGDREVESSR